jgi:secreted Zn-dependent insulinase-like peptidase
VSIFEYLKLLRSKPLPAWTFSELKRILEMAFKFQEATSPADKALEISTDLHNTWPRSEVLHGSYAVTDEDAEKVKYALSYLVKEKARVTVASQKPVEGLTYDQREKWYGTEYQVQSLDNRWFEVRFDSGLEKLSTSKLNKAI